VSQGVDVVGTGLEALGVAIIAVGSVAALCRGALHSRQASRRTDAYRRSRQQIARAVLLGLELLVASDIVRTVAVEPTFVSVGVLGLVILVRTFLSVTLTLEIEGRGPWRGREQEVGQSG
jgi:uncharacterized membrane protein